MKPNKQFNLKTKKNQAGVLLVEVMIAIVIFSFGLLGLVGLQAVAAQNSTNAEERGRASMLANDIVTLMWIKQTVNLPADDVKKWGDKDVGDCVKIGLPNAACNVDVSGNLATITVAWKSPSKKIVATDGKVDCKPEKAGAENCNRYVTNVAIPAP